MIKGNKAKVWEWGTRDEIRFLDRIKSGKSVIKGREEGLTKAEIKRNLYGYILGMKQRVNWDNIDRIQVERWLVRNGYMKKNRISPLREESTITCRGSGY